MARHKVSHIVGVGRMIDSDRQCAPCLADDRNECEGADSRRAACNGPMRTKAKAPDDGNIYGKDNTFGVHSDVLVVRADFALESPPACHRPSRRRVRQAAKGATCASRFVIEMASLEQGSES